MTANRYTQLIFILSIFFVVPPVASQEIQTWEYRVFVLDNPAEGAYPSAGDNISYNRRTSEELTAAIGSQGWEIIAIYPKEIGNFNEVRSFYAYAKRPSQP